MNVTSRTSLHLDGGEVFTDIFPLEHDPGRLGLRIGPTVTLFGTPEQIRDFFNAGLNQLGAYQAERRVTVPMALGIDSLADDEPTLVAF